MLLFLQSKKHTWASKLRRGLKQEVWFRGYFHLPMALRLHCFWQEKWEHQWRGEESNRKGEQHLRRVETHPRMNQTSFNPSQSYFPLGKDLESTPNQIVFGIEKATMRLPFNPAIFFIILESAPLEDETTMQKRTNFERILFYRSHSTYSYKAEALGWFPETKEYAIRYGGWKDH